MSKGRRRWMCQLRDSAFTLPLPFCSVQALKGLDDAHLHRQERSLLSLLIQKLISSRETLQTDPEIIFYQLPGQRKAGKSRQ